jgi:D-alanyl-D-alanine carboxypeptidase
MISALIGFLLSNIILNGFFPDNLAARADFLSPQEQGRVLGAFENINHLPAAAYNYFNPENYLPNNEDKKYFPVKKGDTPLSVQASSSLVMDAATGEILWQSGANDKRSIASISKLMSTLVFLDSVPDWNKIYKMKKSDVRVGGRSHIYEGEEVTTGDLFHLSLVASDNTAVIALISSLGLSEDEFVAKMNQKAKEIGLKDTSFRDATGLSFYNVSTVKDIAILANKALVRKNIREAALKQKYEFKTLAGRKVVAESTDDLLINFPKNGSSLIGGKTGYTYEAGYCFVGGFENSEGRQIFAAVLGTPTCYARFNVAKKIADWAFANFEWKIAN